MKVSTLTKTELNRLATFNAEGLGSVRPSNYNKAGGASWPLSLSGVKLDGNSLVRKIYVDEGGISANESILVVAGVIVHADSQLIPIEEVFWELIDTNIYKEDRDNFIFHAEELFHGSGKIFNDRSKYPLKRRCTLLKNVLAIPSLLRLPVVFGFIRREKPTQRQSQKSAREELGRDHAYAFSYCAIAAEMFMRNHTQGEVAEITAEENTQTRKTVAQMHDLTRTSHPRYKEWIKNHSVALNLPPSFFPLRKIREAINYQNKRGASLLQLSDACAWIIRAYLSERTDIDDFLTSFIPSGPHKIADMNLIRAAHAGVFDIRCWE